MLIIDLDSFIDHNQMSILTRMFIFNKQCPLWLTAAYLRGVVHKQVSGSRNCKSRLATVRSDNVIPPGPLHAPPSPLTVRKCINIDHMKQDTVSFWSIILRLTVCWMKTLKEKQVKRSCLKVKSQNGYYFNNIDFGGFI